MKSKQIRNMVGVAILMAIVIVLQLLGQFVKFGPASVSLVLVPIIVGAAIYGPGAGALLGFTFGVVVLLQPDTSFFYGMNVFGTVVIVLLKGTLCGYLSGLIYRLLSKKNSFFGVIVAAMVCPVINTSIFFLGCLVFFKDALAATGIENVALYVITVFIGINFIAEFAVNVVCAPMIERLLRTIKKQFA